MMYQGFQYDGIWTRIGYNIVMHRIADVKRSGTANIQVIDSWHWQWHSKPHWQQRPASELELNVCAGNRQLEALDPVRLLPGLTQRTWPWASASASGARSQTVFDCPGDTLVS